MADPKIPQSTPQAASLALRRFGLGARRGEMAKVAADPRGYVLAQLSDAPLKVGRLTIDESELDPSHESFRQAAVLGQQQRLANTLKREAAVTVAQSRADDLSHGIQGNPLKRPPLDLAPEPPAATMPGAATDPSAPAVTMPPQKRGQVIREIYREEAEARIGHMIASDTPFLERWVLFWSNHFCVNAQKGNVRVLVGGYEREAIRPRALGLFVDLLKAVEMHPAMLIYLDNQLSFGPNSPAGRNQKRGLNENLAREILELHTLGVNGGYTQADVTAFANILTGWTVGQIGMQNAVTGMFHFLAPRKEPGAHTVVGKSYSSNEGARAGARVLEDLALHPATAKTIATKLARHFIGDAAPQTLIDALERSFRTTNGDLAALAKTLVTHEAGWTTPMVKSLPPIDYLVSIARGIQPRIKPLQIFRLAGALGQPVWSVPSPKGWPDDDNAWAGPSAMRERLRLAEQLAPNIDRALDPRSLAADLLGPEASPFTTQAIARAETREQGLELLMMSPDLARR